MLKKWIAEVIALAISFGTQATLEGAERPSTNSFPHLERSFPMESLLSTSTSSSELAAVSRRTSIEKISAPSGESNLQTVSQPPESGTQIVQQIDQAYQGGEYDDFLSTLHTHYQTAGKAGALRGIFESAKNAMHKTHHDILTSLKLKRHEVAKLSKERNQRLLRAVSENPELEIVQKVDTVVFTSVTDEQDDILHELEALKFEIPETAKAIIENKISAIETEYYIKSLLLDIGDHRTKEDVQDLEKKKTILQLSKLDKMLEAASEYGEKNWEEKIEKAKAAYRAKRAFTMDYEVLQNLARGNTLPQNSVEEKVKEIMMDYLTQRELALSEVAQN